MIKKLMDFIAQNVLRVSFIVIFIVAIFIKAEYSFDDSPFFSLTSIIDLISFALVILGFVLVYKKRQWIQGNLNYKVCFCLYMIISSAYVILVPLTPFSDMEAVYKGAINFAQLEWIELLKDGYWNIFPGNIRLSVFWGILLLPLPKSLLTLKIINILMIYGIIYFVRKLAELYKLRYYNVVYLLVLSFMPLLLYANHVYFDIPLVLLCSLALYVDKKYSNIIITCILLGVAGFLRRNALIFLVGVCIIYLFDRWEDIKTRKGLLLLGRLLIGIILYFLVSRVPSNVIKNIFIEGNFQSYPALWNQIYIGLNEEEFGFMNNDFSYERNGEDVLNRICEYGPYRLTKIITKKTFWLWSQGTYQAQRYAFGNNSVYSLDKFEYETVITKYLMDDEQFTRSFLNSFMRAQYMFIFGLMIISMMKSKKIDRFRLFYYLFMATFLIMLVYELKSRYILYLMPMMFVFAGDTIEIFEKIERKDDTNDKF